MPKKRKKKRVQKVMKVIKRKLKRKPRVVKPSKTQTGKRKSLKADRRRKAMLPGKRISKTGKTYYERRRNRSDLKRKSGWI